MCEAIRDQWVQEFNIPEQVCAAMHKSMDANGITGDGYIRLVLTRGVGSLGISVKHTACPMVFIIADKIALYPPEVYARGLHCVVSSLTRNHPNTTSPRVKSLNYLNNIMAKLEAQDAGADEAIMLTTNGTVCECTGDNIFVVRDGEIFTPPTSEGILESCSAKRLSFTDWIPIVLPFSTADKISETTCQVSPNSVFCSSSSLRT